MTAPADIQAAFAATLVDESVHAGVTDAVVAPGSRSTPVLAALAEDGRLHLHVVLDERSAGFVALGLGLATGRPAPVVTTSGTASVELHPAVVEAHQGGVALVAVTADRPPELHGVGAPQTVEQEGIFAATTRWAVSPGVAESASMSSWRPLATRSVAAATSGPGGPGPVQLNLAFREPLLGDASRVAAPPGRPGGEPWHLVAAPAPTPPGTALVELLAGFAGGRGLLVVGAGAGVTQAAEQLVGMARRLAWPVLADPRSGARVPEPEVVGAFDALLRAAPVKDWTPDVVVRVGRPLASKVLGEWLAALPPSVPQVLVDPEATWSDPDRRVGLITSCSAEGLAAAVVAAVAAAGSPLPAAGSPAPAAAGVPPGAPSSPGTPPAATSSPGAPPGSWLPGWQRAEATAQAALHAALGPDLDGAPNAAGGEADGLTEPGIARLVSAALPDDAILVASSSMPARDIEWFAAPRRGLRVVSNRGANGIDGVVSTAIGVALAGRPTVALIGDLAFAYDVSALLWATRRPIDCTFVLVDNDGGGIFSFLPQAAAVPPPRFERLWGTPHGLDLLAIARAYGATGSDVSSPVELAAGLQAVGTGPGVRVLRCATDRADNVVVHGKLNAAVAAAVGRLGL